MLKLDVAARARLMVYLKNVYVLCSIFNVQCLIVFN